MMYLRACLRCQGDVLLDRDTYGAFFKCLQCGFSRDIPGPDEQRQTAQTCAQGEVAGAARTTNPDERAA